VTQSTQNKQDILMVGVGGQGIILASDILGDAALALGLDVKKTDTLGMAQRGGSVTSHLRIGPVVHAPLISPHGADILLAFEKLEAARWVNYIRPDGIVIINNHAIPPLSISLGTQKYPDDKAITESFLQRTKKVLVVEGSKETAHMGDIRTLNIFMLGFLSALLPIKIETELWNKCISERLPAKIIDLNIRAFARGREVAASANI
jgi:indolepyruvate ferredoxin oxidoreductase, beta subunit